MHRVLNERERKLSVTPLREITPAMRVQSKIPWRDAAVLSLVLVFTTAAVLAKLSPTFALKAINGPAPTLSPASNLDVPAAPPGEPPAERTAIDSPEPSASAVVRKDMANRSFAPKAAARATALAISVDPSQVRSTDHFAEIRVRRNLSQQDGGFAWWTEPATAKPNVDYVPESVPSQSFPAGYRMTHLYVKLLPPLLRSRRSFFYIVIAQPGRNQEPASVIRRQIWLPGASNLQAHR
jgi:hypothetical protein